MLFKLLQAFFHEQNLNVNQYIVKPLWAKWLVLSLGVLNMREGLKNKCKIKALNYYREKNNTVQGSIHMTCSDGEMICT
jgi:hypothetical protein